MRSGRLLTEESPSNLLSNHDLTSLEDVFLKLCMKDVSSSCWSSTSSSAPSTVATSVASTPVLMVTDKEAAVRRAVNREQQTEVNAADNPQSLFYEQQQQEINGNEHSTLQVSTHFT